MCTLINQFQKTINLFWELTILAKRVIVGIRISLLIAIVATLIDLIIGVTYGLVSGFLGGKLTSSCNMLLRSSHLSLTWS